MDEFRPLSAIRENQKLTTELVVFAFALALAVNLLSSALSTIGGTVVQLSLSLILLVGTALYARQRYFGRQRCYDEIEAAVALDAGNNDMIEMPGYEFSESICGLLKAVISENAALGRQWYDDPISKCFEFDLKNGATKRRQSDGAKILREVSEYEILTSLAMKIGDYYNRQGVREKDLEVISRSKALELIHSNRVLDILSRDPKDRAAFIDSTGKGSARGDDFTNTVSIWGASGARYNMFEFKLPKKSALERINNGFRISTPNVVAAITIHVPGFLTNSIPSYENLILHRNVISTLFYVVKIEVEVTSHFSFRNMDSSRVSYGWIDSFLRELREKCAVENYFTSLQWPNVLATVSALNTTKSEPKPISEPALAPTGEEVRILQRDSEDSSNPKS